MSTQAFAEVEAKNSKIYNEIEFLQTFKGKSKEFVLGVLGEPTRKAIPVKPTDSKNFVGERAKISNEKPDVIEMWHYKNLVRYTSKEIYKDTELTFINDSCRNITYINR